MFDVRTCYSAYIELLRREVKTMTIRSFTLPIDSPRLGMDATGIVSAVFRFQTETERQAGSARVQELSEDGRPVWTVEALWVIEQYGTHSTEVIHIRIPAKVQPVVPPGPVQFNSLTASVRLSKGQVYWAADGIETVSKSARISDHAAA
jgi:hypothetical protein